MRQRYNITEHSGSITIMSIYDPCGIVDDYIIFYLSSLKTVTDRIIIAVNGELTSTGKSKLSTVTDEIYIRKNTGFDFGAYKDVVENYLRPEEITQYQELILCNDTCFGPFIPFTDIFSEMNVEDLGVWSINYMDDCLLPHFQSYFLVFRGEGIKIILDFLHEEVDSRTTELAQVHGYEHALSEILLMEGVKSDFYTSKTHVSHNIDIFRAPDYAIKYLGFPMLKKKAFSEDFYKKENCLGALYLIAENTGYPLRYILESVKRIYQKDVKNEMISPYRSDIYTFGGNDTTREEVIEFCRKHRKVYVYGNGYMSVLFMARFRRYMNEFGGYIVSDDYFEKGFYKGEKIYPLSCIERNTPIVVALMKQSTLQVMDKILGWENVLFLSLKPENAL